MWSVRVLAVGSCCGVGTGRECVDRMCCVGLLEWLCDFWWVVSAGLARVGWVGWEGWLFALRRFVWHGTAYRVQWQGMGSRSKE